jgi:hypothetical protein
LGSYLVIDFVAYGGIELYLDCGIEKTLLEKSLLTFRMKFGPKLANSQALTKEEEAYMNAVG